MPMRLDDGWNQIQFNLPDFTRRAYGTNYIEALKVHVCFESVIIEKIMLKDLQFQVLGSFSFMYKNN